MSSVAASKKDRLGNQDPVLTGTLVRIHPDGYGFIRTSDGSEEYFVNIVNWPDRSKWVEGVACLFRGTPRKERSKAPKALDIQIFLPKMKGQEHGAL